jgi:hypothetical protein
MKLSYEKEYRHCLENSNKRELVDKIIYDTKIFIKKDKDIKELHNKIDKAIELIESYNLGKYDYSIPPIGIIELLEILKGDVNE